MYVLLETAPGAEGAEGRALNAFTRLKTWKSGILGRNLIIFGYPQNRVLPPARRIFWNRRKIITMTCRGFRTPEFSILGRSYVAYFFYLASKCYTNLVARRTWFFATPGWAVVGLTSSSISGSTCGRSHHEWLRPFREVRLQRDKSPAFGGILL